MCTVSFVPLKDSYCITSNRDESILREKAIPPTKYLINNKEIYFPKDPKAGGTWIAHNNKSSIVLLNGAKEKHIHKTDYRKSRGLIVLDLISSINPTKEWESIDLDNIEPFTIVLFSEEKLFQLQWDGIEKESVELDANQNHIWSSSTLYEKEIRERRAIWFKEFIKSENNIDSQKLLNFHQFTESKNKNFGLQINRNNILKTISITQCIISKNDITFNYIDLLD
ncbi:NRDE family protein [uncultured Flavobacterium sp.]|uniref:NRDE family protein n=1 Tax=uncultured Flavobacterium sp. TaxID=165435 RepID=UPI0030EB7EF3|tara:strand:+ start:67810 stop:68484 length:675 start_codon:yes stop_codon:yes gene_type:complete